METHSSTKDAILSENVFEKELSQKIIVKKLTENGPWISRVGRFGKWNNSILRLQNIPKSHLSQRLTAEKKTVAAHRGSRLGSAPFPEPGIIAEELRRKCQIHKKNFTENLDLITDTHLGKMICKDTEDHKTIRQTSEFILTKKNPALKKTPVNVTEVRRPSVVSHCSPSIRELTLKKSLLNAMNVGRCLASSHI